METVSVIICAHASERLPLLLDAMTSIQHQSHPALELIVVVDHNDELRARLVAGRATVIANTNGRGLSGARNCGVSAASGDIVAFIDDDARAAPDWIANLLAHYADPAVMAVGGRIDPAWPDKRPHWWPEEFDWVIGCSYRGQPQSAGAVRNLIGCNMSFRRSVFDVCGGFSARLGRTGADAAGGEETELCIRAQSAFPLSEIRYDPKVRVTHTIEPGRVNWSYFAKRCRAEGRSKARLRASGAGTSALASETAYVRRTLPQGLLKSLAGGHVQKAAAIIAGLALTTGAYLRARPGIDKGEGAGVPPFAPIKITQIELSAPIADIDLTDPISGRIYGGAYCLVRDHGVPLGVARFAGIGGVVPAEDLSRHGRALQRPRPGIDDADVVLPTAAVIVATRDRPEMLAKCLDTLLAQTWAPREIHVVDSAPSTAATKELIARRYAASSVIYHHEPNPGLGRAHNKGLAGTRADIVAFTDDDVLVDGNWLEVICSAFARDSALGCVTGLILPAELETRAQWWIEAHGGFSKGFEPKRFDLDRNRPKSALFPYASGMFGSGANMAFSRRCLDAIGGFDPALGAGTLARGGDDLAAFTATILAGYRLAYEPGAIVWHHHRRTEEGMAGQAYGYGVGLGAYLTKTLLDNPSSTLAYMRGLPAALVHILGPRSTKNARLPSDYPSALKWAERRGIATGLPAYVRSRRHAVARDDRSRDARPSPYHA